MIYQVVLLMDICVRCSYLQRSNMKYSGTTIGTQYFVPPSRNPDILPDTPSGVSGSPKLTKITDGR